MDSDPIFDLDKVLEQSRIHEMQTVMRSGVIGLVLAVIIIISRS